MRRCNKRCTSSSKLAVWSTHDMWLANGWPLWHIMPSQWVSRAGSLLACCGQLHAAARQVIFASFHQYHQGP